VATVMAVNIRRKNSDFFEIREAGHVDLTMNYLSVSVNLGFRVK